MTDAVDHLAKVLTESDVHAVRIIWMLCTVSKLKVIKFQPPTLPDWGEEG